jgi:hypothetical protein
VWGSIILIHGSGSHMNFSPGLGASKSAVALRLALAELERHYRMPVGS